MFVDGRGLGRGSACRNARRVRRERSGESQPTCDSGLQLAGRGQGLVRKRQDVQAGPGSTRLAASACRPGRTLLCGPAGASLAGRGHRLGGACKKDGL